MLRDAAAKESDQGMGADKPPREVANARGGGLGVLGSPRPNELWKKEKRRLYYSRAEL